MRSDFTDCLFCSSEEREILTVPDVWKVCRVLGRCNCYSLPSRWCDQQETQVNINHWEHEWCFWLYNLRRRCISIYFITCYFLSPRQSPVVTPQQQVWTCVQLWGKSFHLQPPPKHQHINTALYIMWHFSWLIRHHNLSLIKCTSIIYSGEKRFCYVFGNVVAVHHCNRKCLHSSQQIRLGHWSFSIVHVIGVFYLNIFKPQSAWQFFCNANIGQRSMGHHCVCVHVFSSQNMCQKKISSQQHDAQFTLQ